MKNFSKLIAFILTFVLLTIYPTESGAKYKDKSGDLPGTVSDGTIIALGAVAAAGIGVLVYVLVKKNKQEKATSTLENYKTMETILWENQIIKLAKEHEGAVSATQSTAFSNFPFFSTMPQNTLSQQMENAKNTIPVDLVVSPVSNQFVMGQRNGVQVGVRIRF